MTAVGAIDAETCEPPPVTLPRRDRVWYTRIDSPIGELILAATPEGLREIEFGSHVSESDFVTRQRERGVEPVRLERIENAAPEVQASCGVPRLSSMSILAVSARGSTFHSTGAAWPFQRAVLEATATVPFGHVETYAGIARKIGKPGATRAVGNALGRNPIPVIVPCHRVIRSDATIGGYTGGLGSSTACSPSRESRSPERPRPASLRVVTARLLRGLSTLPSHESCFAQPRRGAEPTPIGCRLIIAVHPPRSGADREPIDRDGTRDGKHGIRAPLRRKPSGGSRRRRYPGAVTSPKKPAKESSTRWRRSSASSRSCCTRPGPMRC